MWLSWLWPFRRCFEADTDRQAETVTETTPEGSPSKALKQACMSQPQAVALHAYAGGSSATNAAALPVQPSFKSWASSPASTPAGTPGQGPFASDAPSPFDRKSSLRAYPTLHISPSMDLDSPDLRSPTSGVPRTPAPTEDSPVTSPHRFSPEHGEAAPVFRPGSQSPGSPRRSPSRSPSRLSRVSFPHSSPLDPHHLSSTPIGGGEFLVPPERVAIEFASLDFNDDFSFRRKPQPLTPTTPASHPAPADADSAPPDTLPSDTCPPETAEPQVTESAGASAMRRPTIANTSPTQHALEPPVNIGSPPRPRTPPSVGDASLQEQHALHGRAAGGGSDAGVALPMGTAVSAKRSRQTIERDRASSPRGSKRKLEPATPSPMASPAFLTTIDNASPLVVGLANPPGNFRESRAVRLHQTPFEARVDRELEKEARFKALKKAEFRDKLNLIVAAQAQQLANGAKAGNPTPRSSI